MALLFGVFLVLFFAMGQKWYVSIILAARINSGRSSLDDIGNMMTFMFTLVAYIPLRLARI